MGARGAQPAVFCSCPGYQGDWEAIKFEIVSGNINHILINQENVLCWPVPGQLHSSSCYLLPEHWCLGPPSGCRRHRDGRSKYHMQEIAVPAQKVRLQLFYI